MVEGSGLVVTMLQANSRLYHVILIGYISNDHISLTGLLQTLCVQDGTADSAQNKTNLRDVTVLRDDFDYPLFGLKKNLVRLLGNLCYGDRSNQDKVSLCVYTAV